MTRQTKWISLMLFGLALAVAAPRDASARRLATEFAGTLSAGERKAFEDWYAAQIFYAASMDAYWAKVETKRKRRRAKRSSGKPFTDRDYVTTFPPTYSGPTIAKALLRRWRAFRDRDKTRGGPKRREELPGIADYLRSAKRHFRFAPERIAESEFKRRYAHEALSYGLTKDQVVRVYALETGGNGTADMQAGISPVSRRGRPISSALGYAQLLAANSVNVLAKHGATFIGRLHRMLRQTDNAGRRRKLEDKLRALRAMVRAAKSIPYKWSRHVAYARTSRGMGLHVMNMDGDIGPWMQVVKLADLKRMAARKGRPELSGAEIELMNLAGPATGLEMMTRTGINKPSTNFFSRRAYYRNSVVRGRRAGELIEALEGRMRQNIKNKGAQEFLAIFDGLLRQRVPRPRAATRAANDPAPYPFRPQ